MKPKFEKDAQLTLGGATMSESEWALALQSVPDVSTRCPFCLTQQGLRSMCFALPDGTLSKRRRCRNCHKEMQATSATVFMHGEKEYGTWVATYPRFWMVVNHDRFMEALQSLKELHQWKVWEFWDAYRAIRPKKTLDAQGYPTQEQPKPKDEFEDEWEATKKRHTKPDGTIDWDAISAETDALESNLRGRAEPKSTYTFRNVGGQGLPDSVVQGDSLEQDEKAYTVVDGVARQRFLKSGWLLK
ncbi:MAG TPA: hypothetical protein VJR06_02810 [Nitrososphaerales archaeon]|nr:hypothetical protein [Nitrososphaerales archaeon]